MSFQSKVIYTGDGEQYQYTIPFPFLSSSHVKVYINEVLQLEPLMYVRSGSTITFNSIPEEDDAIVIRRWTSPTEIMVDFVDGSTLRATDLDTSYLHNFYLSQEYADSWNELINETLISIATGAGIMETETDAIITALVNEMLNTDAAATIQQRVTDIDNNAEAILSLTDSLQVQINTLAQGVAANVYLDDDEPVPGVDPYPDPIAEGARWYDTNDNNHPYIYQSSAWVSIEDVRIGQAVANIDLLGVSVENNYAAILAEQFAQATDTFALAQSLSILGAQSGDGSAFIIDLDTVKIDSDQGVSLASRFSTLDASVGANSSAITTEQTARADGDSAIASTFALLGAENGGQTAFILNEDTVKIDTDGGDTLATRFSGLSAADASNAADISTEETTRIAQDAVVAGTVTTLAVRVTDAEGDINAAEINITSNVGAINAANSNITTLEAKYGVSLNVNGYVTGFVQNNDGSSGTFVILADKFAVVDPSGDPAETEYVPFQIVGGKVRFNADVEIDGDLMVSGTINGSALINGTIGSTQIGANAITTTQLNADSVNASHIIANSVTASEINVTNLSSMSADLGTVTAGTITLDSTGHLKSVKNSFADTTAGWWLGIESTVGKFHIGNSTDFLKWDGTSLIVRGNISLGTYELSTNIMLTAATQRDNQDYDTWVEVKKFEINRPGEMHVNYQRKMTIGGGPFVAEAGWRIKLDGVVKHTHTAYTGTWSERDYVLTALDTSQYITLEIKAGRDTSGSTGSEIKDVYLLCDKSDGESVITN